MWSELLAELWILVLVLVREVLLELNSVGFKSLSDFSAGDVMKEVWEKIKEN